MKKYLGTALSWLVYIYLGGVFIVFTPYFNWKYAQENGFWNWVVFGEVVATAKAVAWPYYVVVMKESASTAAKSVSNSIKLANQGNAIINRGGPYSAMTDADMRAVINYYQQALAEARNANIQELNKRHPSFGDHFQSEFIGGLEMYIKSYESGDTMRFVAAQAMLDNWGNWYGRNINAIRGK